MAEQMMIFKPGDRFVTVSELWQAVVWQVMPDGSIEREQYPQTELKTEHAEPVS